MKISRLNKVDNCGKIRAFFDVETDEGFTIKGFKLIDGINGFFVGCPSEKNKSDDEYYDTVWLEKELKEELRDMAKEAYEKEVPIKQDFPFE